MYDNKLFIDIETLPPQGGEHLARIRATIKPPAQYKKPDSIAQWMAENADALALEEFGRLGLDGLYGQIACIGFAMNDGLVQIVSAPKSNDEAGLLRGAFSLIETTSSDLGGPRYLSPVGHNIEFDVRFLMQRAVRHSVEIPRCLRNAFDPEKGRFQCFDTMRVWSGFKGFTKLKDLSRELLGDDGSDIDGSEVAATWAADPAKVIEHCRRDVERVRALYKRMASTLYGEAA